VNEDMFGDLEISLWKFSWRQVGRYGDLACGDYYGDKFGDFNIDFLLETLKIWRKNISLLKKSKKKRYNS
jgi:hypothetical protein